MMKSILAVLTIAGFCRCGGCIRAGGRSLWLARPADAGGRRQPAGQPIPAAPGLRARAGAAGQFRPLAPAPAAEARKGTPVRLHDGRLKANQSDPRRRGRHRHRPPRPAAMRGRRHPPARGISARPRALPRHPLPVHQRRPGPVRPLGRRLAAAHSRQPGALGARPAHRVRAYVVPPLSAHGLHLRRHHIGAARNGADPDQLRWPRAMSSSRRVRRAMPCWSWTWCATRRRGRRPSCCCRASCPPRTCISCATRAPAASGTAPDFGAELATPEWRFRASDLRRFKDDGS